LSRSPPPPRSTLFPYTTLFRSQCHQRRCKESACWIASHPLSTTGENASAARLNRLVFKPAFEIFGERDSGRVAALWILNTSRFRDRKSTRLNSSHVAISYAVFC